MHMELLDAFRDIDSQTTSADVLEACRQLFLDSDEYRLPSGRPFSESEVDRVATAIFVYIDSLDLTTYCEIRFDTRRVLEGRSLDYDEYASMFSEDMLFEHARTPYESLNRDDLVSHLKVVLVGILFRYRFCVHEGRAAFPVSVLLDYMDRLRVLLAHENREHELSKILWTTLRALRFLEVRDSPESSGSKSKRGSSEDGRDGENEKQHGDEP